MSEESAGRWMTGTSLGEGIAVVILLGMLAALAVTGTRGVQSRVKVLEAIFLASSGKTQWIEHWAVTGLWPTRQPADGAAPVSVLPPSANPMNSYYVEPIQEDVADGSLSFRFAEPRTVAIIEGVVYRAGDAALQGYSVGVRPAFAPAQTPTSVVWLCGYAEPPLGFVAPTKNLTNAPAALLPGPCRAPLPAER